MNNTKRFLRDNTLHTMLNEIQLISNKVSTTDIPNLMFTQSLTSISELYETNMLVLQRLEQAIEEVRANESPDVVLERLVEAAAHVQMGLVSVHGALKEDINTLLDMVVKLQDSFTDNPEK